MFGKFIEQGRDQVVFGYYIGAGLMIAAGVVAMFLAVNAERRSLEDVAKPLTAHDGEHDDRIDLSSTEDREPAGAPTRT
jgi:hypothetical protein